MAVLFHSDEMIMSLLIHAGFSVSDTHYDVATDETMIKVDGKVIAIPRNVRLGSIQELQSWISDEVAKEAKH